MSKTLLALYVAAASIGGFPAPCSVEGRPTIKVTYVDLPGSQVGEAALGRCLIRLDRRRFTERMRCAVIAHEMGHIIGHYFTDGFFGAYGEVEDHGHSPDHTDLMYPFLSSDNIPPLCKHVAWR